MARQPTKIELGGGYKPLPGFFNVDLCDGADHKMNLDIVGAGREALPFESDSVDEVYSSHCFEHLKYHKFLLHEIVRICKVGARFELRVPHWNQSMAMCGGHEQTMSEEGVAHWREFADHWWDDKKKWLSVPSVSWEPTKWFHEAQQLFPQMTREQVLRFIPNTCHETRFVFHVEERPKS
jgi:SAM-dependent methyltransferase